uniref:PPM-type phosphatase domain-containing protein n=1 Tax=Pyramimonas obovata TaxID=1411642 RepID=A0A7S0RQ37_9CHLO|mmetsp:Transcript_39439/g.85812  ORF Transcript_39439/g.85812 Transcript_39439/m.85812 type:complete len:1398 (-) Transcript_39439:248-4441(-)
MLLISDFLVRSRFTRSPTLRTIRLMCSFCGLRVDVSVVRAGISPNHSSMAGLLICAGPASASLVGLRASGAAAAASSAGAGGAQITSPEVGRSVDTPSAFSCCSLQLLSAASKYLLAALRSCKEQHEKAEGVSTLRPTSGEVIWAPPAPADDAAAAAPLARNPTNDAEAGPAQIRSPAIEEWFGEIPARTTETSTLRPQKEHIKRIVRSVGERVNRLRTKKSLINSMNLNKTFEEPRDEGQRLTKRSLDTILAEEEQLVEDQEDGELTCVDSLRDNLRRELEQTIEKTKRDISEKLAQNYSTRERARSTTQTYVVPDAATVDAVARRLRQQHPALTLTAQRLVTWNRSHIQGIRKTYELKAGDTIYYETKGRKRPRSPVGEGNEDARCAEYIKADLLKRYMEDTKKLSFLGCMDLLNQVGSRTFIRRAAKAAYTAQCKAQLIPQAAQGMNCEELKAHIRDRLPAIVEAARQDWKTEVMAEYNRVWPIVVERLLREAKQAYDGFWTWALRQSGQDSLFYNALASRIIEGVRGASARLCAEWETMTGRLACVRHPSFPSMNVDAVKAFWVEHFSLEDLQELMQPMRDTLSDLSDLLLQLTHGAEWKHCSAGGAFILGGMPQIECPSEGHVRHLFWSAGEAVQIMQGIATPLREELAEFANLANAEIGLRGALARLRRELVPLQPAGDPTSHVGGMSLPEALLQTAVWDETQDGEGAAIGGAPAMVAGARPQADAGVEALRRAMERAWQLYEPTLQAAGESPLATALAQAMVWCHVSKSNLLLVTGSFREEFQHLFLHGLQTSHCAYIMGLATRATDSEIEVSFLPTRLITEVRVPDGSGGVGQTETTHGEQANTAAGGRAVETEITHGEQATDTAAGGQAVEMEITHREQVVDAAGEELPGLQEPDLPVSPAVRRHHAQPAPPREGPCRSTTPECDRPDVGYRPDMMVLEHWVLRRSRRTGNLYFDYKPPYDHGHALYSLYLTPYEQYRSKFAAFQEYVGYTLPADYKVPHRTICSRNPNTGEDEYRICSYVGVVCDGVGGDQQYQDPRELAHADREFPYGSARKAHALASYVLKAASAFQRWGAVGRRDGNNANATTAPENRAVAILKEAWRNASVGFKSNAPVLRSSGPGTVPRGALGASTVVVATLHFRYLHIASVGDSQIAVLRRSAPGVEYKCVYLSEVKHHPPSNEQSHTNPPPAQLLLRDVDEDPRHGGFSLMVQHEMQLQEDDLVIAGSDGFFDNLNVPRNNEERAYDRKATKEKLETLCNEAVRRAPFAHRECEKVAERMYLYSANMMHDHGDVDPNLHLTRFTQHRARAPRARGWEPKVDDLTLWVARVSMRMHPDMTDMHATERSSLHHVVSADGLRTPQHNYTHGGIEGQLGEKYHKAHYLDLKDET